MMTQSKEARLVHVGQLALRVGKSGLERLLVSRCHGRRSAPLQLLRTREAPRRRRRRFRFVFLTNSAPCAAPRAKHSREPPARALTLGAWPSGCRLGLLTWLKRGAQGARACTSMSSRQVLACGPHVLHRLDRRAVHVRSATLRVLDELTPRDSPPPCPPSSRSGSARRRPRRPAAASWCGLTEKPKESGCSAISRVRSVPFPTPLGPQTTTGRWSSCADCDSATRLRDHDGSSGIACTASCDARRPVEPTPRTRRSIATVRDVVAVAVPRWLQRNKTRRARQRR